MLMNEKSLTKLDFNSINVETKTSNSLIQLTNNHFFYQEPKFCATL